MEKNQREIFNEDDFMLFDEVASLSGELEEEEVNPDIDNEENNEDLEIDVDKDVSVDDTKDEDTEEEEGVVGSEEETDEEIEQNDDEQDDEDNSSLFIPYAKLLVDNDILTTLDLEKFDGTAEGLQEAMRNEIGYYVNKYKETLPEDVQRLVNGYEAGIPFDEMLKISSDRIRYNNIKEEDVISSVDMQKNILKDYYKKVTQFSDEEIENSIEILENSASLEDKAKETLGKLQTIQDKEEKVALERSQKEQEEMQKRQVEMFNQLKTQIETTEEIIPGVKVNKLMKDKISKNLTIPVAYDENNQPINKVGLYSRQNPIQFEIILNYLFEATNEFKDWTVFSKTGKTQALKELETAAKRLDNTSSSARRQRSKPNKGKHDDMLRAIENMIK